MKINNIIIQNFRNLESVEIIPNNKFNLFYGKNGSGKTSLLEALYYSATGKSFRCTIPSVMIANSHDNFFISLKMTALENDYFLGLERTRQGQSSIRLNKENVSSQLAITKLLPMQIFTSKDYRILEDGPDFRRAFLDWGLFHVEQSFLPHWQKMQKALKQRNAILKTPSSNSRKQLLFWDNELIENSNIVDALRRKYITDLTPILSKILATFELNHEISLDYFSGWDNGKTITEVLSENLEIDFKYGFTNSGPHKADLKIKTEIQLAKNVLSRGQQKLLVYAFKLSQGILLALKADKSCIYLIDDLISELDAKKQQHALNTLNEIDAQVFLTGVDFSSFDSFIFKDDKKMFHVEQGKIGGKND